ncbi:MAG: peroxiredoxin [Coprothermobacterota bacterium]|nr:peroxiredoxin [Coprothermobacterota bacterium]
MIQVGKPAPLFCLPDQEGKDICLETLIGQWLVLFFYPRDNTSGCTLEAVDFTSHLERFHSLGAEVIGISPDSPESHSRFRAKHQLKLRLFSDQEHAVMIAYGAWGKKRLYGKEYEGVIRSTFLIDPKGDLRVAWSAVKVKGHVEEVLSALAQEAHTDHPRRL